MNRDDIRKLLGGYATGTLTPEEQEALFEAALNDQALFDELAREQSLRDLLREPSAKVQVLAALDERPVPWYRRWQTWTASAVAVATALTVAVVMRPHRAVVEVAQVQEMKAPAPPSVAIARDEVVTAPAKPQPPRAAKERRQFTPPSAVLERDAEAPKQEPLPLPAPPPAVAAPAPPPPVFKAAEPANERKDVQVQNSAVNQFAPSDNASQVQVQTQTLLQQQLQAESKRRAAVRDSLSSMPGGIGGAAGMRAENPAVWYTILRKSDTGAFIEAKLDDLKSGDIIELKFETNQSGLLTVMESGSSRTAAAHNMRPSTPWTTSPLRAGVTELEVKFSGAGMAPGAVAFESMDRKKAVPLSGNANVATADRPGQSVNFTIRLNYKP